MLEFTPSRNRRKVKSKLLTAIQVKVGLVMLPAICP